MSQVSAKFKVGDRLEIISGDYEGLYGRVTGVLPEILRGKVQKYTYTLQYENLPKYVHLVGNGFKEQELKYKGE